MNATKSTIRFDATLSRTASNELRPWASLALPKSASTTFPSREATMVEGTINGFPFRAALELRDGRHRLSVSKAVQDAAGAGDSATVTVEITRAGEEAEIRVPMELSKALAAAPAARAAWAEITPAARRDWILWISSAKQSETRQRRIENACDMLASGKRRPCCFGGLKWLTKDHVTADETWLPLSKPEAPSKPHQQSPRVLRTGERGARPRRAGV